MLGYVYTLPVLRKLAGEVSLVSGTKLPENPVMKKFDEKKFSKLHHFIKGGKNYICKEWSGKK